MGFKSNYVQEINDLLMKKRDDNDIQTTLNIPEHKFKKMGDKFNYALRTVYERHLSDDVKMFHILLSLQNYFDMQWLVENVLDDENKKNVVKEMKEEYNIKKTVKRKDRIPKDEDNGAGKKKKRRSTKS